MTDPYVGPVAHDSGTGNLPVVRIVIHCTVGSDGVGASGTASYFRDPAAKGSAHAVCDNDQTLICAWDPVVCWHAPPNPHSLGIELCCSLSNQGQGHWTLPGHVAMMKRAAKWTAEKCHKHNIPVRKLTVAQVKAGEKGICGHIDVSNAFGQSTHWDPGPYFPWPQFIAYVNDYYSGTATEDDSMSAQDVENLKDWIRGLLNPDVNGTLGKWHQEWVANHAATLAAVAELRAYMAAVSIQVQKHADQIDDEAEILAALDALETQVSAVQALVTPPPAPEPPPPATLPKA